MPATYTGTDERQISTETGRALTPIEACTSRAVAELLIERGAELNGSPTKMTEFNPLITLIVEGKEAGYRLINLGVAKEYKHGIRLALPPVASGPGGQTRSQFVDLNMSIAEFEAAVSGGDVVVDLREYCNGGSPRRVPIVPLESRPALPEKKKRSWRRKKKEPFKPGTIVADKTIYGGTSEDTDELIFAMPKDVKGPDGNNLTMTFNEAAAYVEMLNAKNAYGHNDWHIATPAEMRALLANREEGALRDSFNLTAPMEKAVQLNESGTIGSYWTSAVENDDQAWSLQALDGKAVPYFKIDKLSLRIVRTVPAGTKPEAASAPRVTERPLADPPGYPRPRRRQDRYSQPMGMGEGGL